MHSERGEIDNKVIYVWLSAELLNPRIFDNTKPEIALDWEVASTRNFQDGTIVKRGQVVATPVVGRGFRASVAITGLSPGSRYFFRFKVPRGPQSQIGTFFTFNADGTAPGGHRLHRNRGAAGAAAGIGGGGGGVAGGGGGIGGIGGGAMGGGAKGGANPQARGQHRTTGRHRARVTEQLLRVLEEGGQLSETSALEQLQKNDAAGRSGGAGADSAGADGAGADGEEGPRVMGGSGMSAAVKVDGAVDAAELAKLAQLAIAESLA